MDVDVKVTQILSLCSELFWKQCNHVTLVGRISFHAGQISFTIVLCMQSDLNGFVVAASFSWSAWRINFGQHITTLEEMVLDLITLNNTHYFTENIC